MTYLAWRKAKNVLMTLLMAAATVAVLIPLVLIFFHIVKMGLSSINLDFFTQIPKPTGETGGGMANGMVGSVVLIALASLLGLPVGIFGAIYLSEYGGSRISTIVRFCRRRPRRHPLDHHRHGRLCAAGGADEGIFGPGRRVCPGPDHDPHRAADHRGAVEAGPRSLREASLALGVPLWRTTLKVTLRSATTGVMTGILLAIARVAGETAPLLFTALGNQFWGEEADRAHGRHAAADLQFRHRPL